MVTFDEASTVGSQNKHPFEDDKDYNSQIHVINGAIVIGTFAFLGLIKLSVYCCLTRDARCMRLRHTRTCHLTCAEKGTETCHCHTRDNEPWHLSDLAVDMFIMPAQVTMALYAIHGTPLMSSPFFNQQAFDSIRYMLCITLGHMCYRFIRAAMKPTLWGCCRFSHMYITVALITYSSILLTEQDQALGVVGMLTQLPVLFCTLRNLAKDDRSSGEEPGWMIWTINILRLVTLVIFSILLPAIYLGVAMSRQSIITMTYYSVAVFSFAAAFFAINHVIMIIKAMSSGCQDVGLTASPEREWLLESSPLRRSIVTRNHDTFPPIVGDVPSNRIYVHKQTLPFGTK